MSYEPEITWGTPPGGTPVGAAEEDRVNWSLTSLQQRPEENGFNGGRWV
jgi:hypothetical protein